MQQRKKVKTINLSLETHTQLRTVAFRLGMPMQEIAEAAIAQYCLLLEEHLAGGGPEPVLTTGPEALTTGVLPPTFRG